MNNDGLLKVKGTHFYMVGGGYYQPIDIMCQSPIYRDTHFYRDMSDAEGSDDDDVSIPYLSGHPFLRY